MFMLKITLNSIPYNQMREKSGLTSSIPARHTILVGLISVEKGIRRLTTRTLKRARIGSLKKKGRRHTNFSKNFSRIRLRSIGFFMEEDQ